MQHSETERWKKGLRLMASGLSLLVAFSCGDAETAKESETTLGPIRQELATRGQELFQVKGCVTCHTIGKGRLVGPDLKGVTKRREYGWYVAMVTKPDSMLRDDPIAQQLLAEHATPMTNQNVTTKEARAIYEYLRRESASAQ